MKRVAILTGGMIPVKAIALVGNIDEQHRLHADVPPELLPGQVRVIVLLPDEEDEVGSRWAHGVAKEWTAELEDRRQDLYTMEDGEPVNLREPLHRTD